MARSSLKVLTRREVEAREKGACFVCGTTYGQQFHHVIPKSMFGKETRELQDDKRNVVLVCGLCHRGLHTHGWRQALLVLLHKRHGYTYPEAKFTRWLGEVVDCPGIRGTDDQ